MVFEIKHICIQSGVGVRYEKHYTESFGYFIKNWPVHWDT